MIFKLCHAFYTQIQLQIFLVFFDTVQIYSLAVDNRTGGYFAPENILADSIRLKFPTSDLIFLTSIERFSN